LACKPLSLGCLDTIDMDFNCQQTPGAPYLAGFSRDVGYHCSQPSGLKVEEFKIAKIGQWALRLDPDGD
jgi:hypothetical protein